MTGKILLSPAFWGKLAAQMTAGVNCSNPVNFGLGLCQYRESEAHVTDCSHRPHFADNSLDCSVQPQLENIRLQAH